jgi:glycosyltransferase involved in cell wall biosynthesis
MSVSPTVYRVADLPTPPAGRVGWPWTEDTPPGGEPPAGLIHWPRISIVTPSFRQGHYIEETIRSVLLQGYPNLEYRVFDGGSTDDTVAILQKYEPFLTSWVSEPDKGQSDAINKGLAQATGDVFNWLNSDDFYTPGTLQRVAQLMAQPGVTCVSGQSRVFRGTIDHTLHLYPGVTSYPDNLARTIAKLNIGQPETFFALSAVRAMGPLSPQLHFCMDAEWWLKYLLLFGNNQVKKTEDVFVNFRLHDDSKTVSLARSFYADRAALFYDLASRHNDPLSEYIRPLVNPKLLDRYHFSLEVPAALWQAARSDLWFYFATVWYELEDYRRAAHGLRQVNAGALLPADAALCQRLRSRLRWLPTPLLRYLRRRKHRPNHL